MSGPTPHGEAPMSRDHRRAHTAAGMLGAGDGEHVLGARVDLEVRADAPSREGRRARLLWELDTYRENMTTAEIAELVTAGRAIVGCRP